LHQYSQFALAPQPGPYRPHHATRLGIVSCHARIFFRDNPEAGTRAECALIPGLRRKIAAVAARSTRCAAGAVARNSGGVLLRCGLVILLACYSRPCAAQAAPDWNAHTLAGDWGGARTRMSERGLTTDLMYTGDVLADVSGGSSRGAKYMDNIDIRFELDLGRFAGWSGASVLLHIISEQGSGLNAHNVQSFMGVDNIEVDADTTKLYQA
jgi:carbohydrate-selective porin OprB